jgi:hypothetical protein|nr:hypothetical protein [Neorhizobium tomejilense]
MSEKVEVLLGSSIPLHIVNRDKVKQKAVALAETYLLPTGVAFASFEHNGKTFAISARLSIEVDMMPGRVPDQVIRDGGFVVPKRRKVRFAPKPS